MLNEATFEDEHERNLSRLQSECFIPAALHFCHFLNAFVELLMLQGSPTLPNSQDTRVFITEQEVKNEPALTCS